MEPTRERFEVCRYLSFSILMYTYVSYVSESFVNSILIYCYVVGKVLYTSYYCKLSKL